MVPVFVVMRYFTALSRAYSRIHPVDDDNLSALINILEKHIEEEGMSAIDKCGEEVTNVCFSFIEDGS